MQKPKVILKNVYKEYSLLKSNKDKLKGFFFKNEESKSFFAVKNISFEVYPGETIGIIGINGSGKSTLSNLLGQVIPPTVGNIDIDGETSLIAISVGLNGQLSGLENIELKCLMHGMTTKETEIVMPKIIEFADLGKFIDQPVKNYSSGMKSRLGFAISVHTNPDVLVVDEALSVGDQTFYDKCMKKIQEFKDDGKTIFFISHSAGQMRKVSDRVMWIHYGEMKEFGAKDEILDNYGAFIKWFNSLTEKEKKNYKAEMFQKQMKDETTLSQKVKKEITNEEKREFRSIQIQTTIAAILFVFMVFCMITGTSIPFSTQHELPEQAKETEEKKITPVIKGIGQDGFIQVNKTLLYKDEEFEELIMIISLFETVHVIEQIDNKMYKVDKEGTIGFVDMLDVSVDLKPLIELNPSLEMFVPYFSDGFKEAYHYYLAFLGQTTAFVEERVSGLEMKTLENEQLVLEQNNPQFKYIVKDDVVSAIELSVEQPLIINLIEDIKETALINKEKDKYYLEAKDYTFVIDIMNLKLLIQAKND